MVSAGDDCYEMRRIQRFPIAYFVSKNPIHIETRDRNINRKKKKQY